MPLPRRRVRPGVVAAGVLALALGGCGVGGPAPDPTPSAPPPSTATTPSPSTPAAVDVGAPALEAAGTWLEGQGYTVQKVTSDTLRLTDGADSFTTRLRCEGGTQHRVGWLGVCATTPGEGLAVVVPTRVTAGPKVVTVAMDEDAAANCGDETTPPWAVTALETAEESYCILSDEDG